MNIFRSIIYIPSRAISRKNAGIKSKLRILKSSGYEEANLEELDSHDLDEFEADYMNAGQFHKNYEKEEIKRKTLLRKQIVASKYFKKDKDPNFLTSTEKDQIRNLHENDPERWTVEVLSNSFPALPETISKIVKSKWSYKSVEQVMKYDATVVNNWKLYRSGKLPVSPLLQEHLTKFQNRTIVLPDRHILAEKLVPPERKLPKPRSIFFSNIVQSYLDQQTNNQDVNKVLTSDKETTKDTKLLKDISNDNTIPQNLIDKEDPKNKEIILDKNNTALAKQKPSLTRSTINANNTVDTKGHKPSSGRSKITFNEFAKKELAKHYAQSPEKAITLLHAYKKYLSQCDSTSSDIEDTIVESKHVQALEEKEEIEEEEEEEEEKENLNSLNLETSKEEKEELNSLNTETSNKEEGSISLNIDTLEEKKELNSLNLKESDKEEGLISLNIDTSKEKKELNSLNLKESNKEELIISLNESETPQLVSADKIDAKLDTYIKERNSKISELQTYSQPIKIPSKLYQKGKTYRISDCYYDDDGEFLYRVPGVRN